MYDSYGDGWNGNAVTVIVNGEIVISEATFDDGDFDSVTFEATNGDSYFSRVDRWTIFK